MASPWCRYGWASHGWWQERHARCGTNGKNTPTEYPNTFFCRNEYTNDLGLQFTVSIYCMILFQCHPKSRETESNMRKGVNVRKVFLGCHRAKQPSCCQVSPSPNMGYPPCAEGITVPDGGVCTPRCVAGPTQKVKLPLHVACDNKSNSRDTPRRG